MPTSASLVSLLELSFGTLPWRAVPIVGAVLVGLICLCQITSLCLGRRKGSSSNVRIGTTSTSVHAALSELRAKLLKCSVGAEPDAIRIVEELMATAVALGASDVHLSPLENGLSITTRIHGSLHAVVSLPRETSSLVCNRLKVLARLDLHVRSVPQDGRLVLEIGGRTIEARISTLPTEGGERVVLRLVEGGRSIPGLANLGFSREVTDGLFQLLARPQGLLFVTGPVGSGKSTTLYAALSHIYQTRSENTTIVTLEDPIELKLPFATQTQINPRSNMTFASGLRSALRQDPNVLMVGEIRDRETADIAMQASLTGHLLLTTVHSDDATGPFARMIDMGIEPFLLASSVAGVLSQRLVRRLCPACRRLTAPDTNTVARLRALDCAVDLNRSYEPVGCNQCEYEGYAGRVPVAEFLSVDSSVRAELHEGCPAETMRHRAISRGMTPLLVDGLRLVALGETTVTEVLRVAG